MKTVAVLSGRVLRRLMALQVGRRAEALVAIVASVQAGAGVDDEVTDQVALLCVASLAPSIGADEATFNQVLQDMLFAGMLVEELGGVEALSAQSQRVVAAAEVAVGHFGEMLGRRREVRRGDWPVCFGYVFVSREAENSPTESRCEVHEGGPGGNGEELFYTKPTYQQKAVE